MTTVINHYPQNHQDHFIRLKSYVNSLSGFWAFSDLNAIQSPKCHAGYHIAFSPTSTTSQARWQRIGRHFAMALPNRYRFHRRKGNHACHQSTPPRDDDHRTTFNHFRWLEAGIEIAIQDGSRFGMEVDCHVFLIHRVCKRAVIHHLQTQFVGSTFVS
jgi:hypothetical protein